MEGTGAHQKHEDGDGAGRRWLGRSDGDELVLERGDRTWGRGRRWRPEQERTATNRPAAGAVDFGSLTACPSASALPLR